MGIYSFIYKFIHYSKTLSTLLTSLKVQKGPVVN